MTEIDIDVLDNERWTRINTVIPDVRDEYWVSDYGRVYNTLTKHIIGSTKSKSSRYYNVSLYTNDNTQIHIGVHQLVGLCYVNGRSLEKCQVDHINTDHYDNHYTNLEWVTPKENIHRAFRKNLREYQMGENHHFNKYSDDIVHKVCQYTMLGYKPKQITEFILGKNITDLEKARFKRFIKHIKSGEQRTDISSIYGIVKKNSSTTNDNGCIEGYYNIIINVPD